MAYFKIVRGWPSDGALDDIALPAVPGTITAGMLVFYDSNGKLIPANYPADGSGNNNQCGYALDVDQVSGKVSVLMGKFIIETDSFDTVPSGPNQTITASNGKFSVANGTAKVIGTTIQYNPTLGIAKIKMSL